MQFQVTHQARFTTVPWKQIMLKITSFFSLKVLNSDNFHGFSEQVTSLEKPLSKIISFLNYKHTFLSHTLSDKGLKGTVVNWIRHSEIGKLHEIYVLLIFSGIILMILVSSFCFALFIGVNHLSETGYNGKIK